MEGPNYIGEYHLAYKELVFQKIEKIWQWDSCYHHGTHSVFLKLECGHIKSYPSRYPKGFALCHQCTARRAQRRLADGHMNVA